MIVKILEIFNSYLDNMFGFERKHGSIVRSDFPIMGKPFFRRNENKGRNYGNLIVCSIDCNGRCNASGAESVHQIGSGNDIFPEPCDCWACGGSGCGHCM